MTTLHDPPMTKVAPASPAGTEYHDAPSGYEQQQQPRVNIHEPTPTYEKHAPSFPTPHTNGYAPEKNNGILTSGTTSSRHSIGSTNSRRVNYNEDVVLADGNGAGVKRAGTWAHGPGTSGIREDTTGANGVSRHASLAERATMAAENIAPEKYAALTKAEKKDAKRLSKIIKAEGKAEDKQLKSALKELANLQAAQKKASAAETAATTAQTRAAKEEQRASAAYLEAKTRYERAIAGLKTAEERLTLCREQAEKTTGMVRRQAEEVEAMRERKATDDREREVKLANLKAGLMSP
ncbi:hypothetical protein PIIN_09137 [Serendipita indica DSM 11827]|uniref:DNA binding protein Ncp1 n=1 Tax=Serendipita indica (strain DSM 11827) TaxID=1109443 RepID=G4TV10_SERID|nr:hypothetical protein PIIN_09137 [Serendipita indica DSM 11827]